MSSENCADDPFADLIAKMLNNETKDKAEIKKSHFEPTAKTQNGTAAMPKQTELNDKNILIDSHISKHLNLATPKTKAFSKLLEIYEKNKETLFEKGFLPNGDSQIPVSMEDRNWLKSLENEKKEIDRKIEIILKNIKNEDGYVFTENAYLSTDGGAIFKDGVVSPSEGCPASSNENGQGNGDSHPENSKKTKQKEAKEKIYKKRIASRATQLISRKVLSPAQSSFILKTMAAMWKNEVTIRAAWDTLKSIAAQTLPPAKPKPAQAPVKSFISLLDISGPTSEANPELKPAEKKIYERGSRAIEGDVDGAGEKSQGCEDESYYSYSETSHSGEEIDQGGDDKWRLVGREEADKLAKVSGKEDAKLVIYDGNEDGDKVGLTAAKPKLARGKEAERRDGACETAPRMKVDVPAFERMLTHHLGRRRASDPQPSNISAPEELASPTSINKVKCRRCTFLFPAGKTQCGVCGAAADYREPEFWACDHCGYKKNEAVFDSCDVCGT